MTKPACCGTGVQGPEGDQTLMLEWHGWKGGMGGKWDGLESGNMGSLRIHSFANFPAQSIFVVSLHGSILKAAGLVGGRRARPREGSQLGVQCLLSSPHLLLHLSLFFRFEKMWMESSTTNKKPTASTIAGFISGYICGPVPRRNKRIIKKKKKK